MEIITNVLVILGMGLLAALIMAAILILEDKLEERVGSRYTSGTAIFILILTIELLIYYN